MKSAAVAAASSAVADSFDRAAPTYTHHAAVQTALAAWLAEWLPAAAPADPATSGGRNGPALELGAGPGVFTAHLLPWPGGLTATDLAPAMVTAGRARQPGAHWQIAAAESPPPGPWAWIFSSSMLQWVDDPVAVFTAWRRVLAPGGRVLAGFFVEGTLLEWTQLAPGTAPLTWRSPPVWHAALAAAGLELLRADTRAETVAYPSALACLRSVHGVGAAPLPRLGAGTLRQLLHTYTQRHPASGDDGASVQATWVWHRLEARPA